jgi:hypothetical protein
MLGGGFDRLGVVDFQKPAAFSIAVGLLVPWHFANRQLSIRLKLEHEDGTVIQPAINAQMAVGRPPEAVVGQSFRAVLAVNGEWLLAGPGTFRVVATLGENASRRVAIYVHQARLPPGIGQPLPP